MRRNRSIRAMNLPHGHIFGATFLGVPAQMIRARVVKAVVGNSEMEDYWAKDLIGTERQVVEMRISFPDKHYEIFYLDNHDGKTPDKLTKLGGGAELEFRQLNVTAFVPDSSIQVSYGRTQK